MENPTALIDIFIKDQYQFPRKKKHDAEGDLLEMFDWFSGISSLMLSEDPKEFLTAIKEVFRKCDLLNEGIIIKSIIIQNIECEEFEYALEEITSDWHETNEKMWRATVNELKLTNFRVSCFINYIH